MTASATRPAASAVEWTPGTACVVLFGMGGSGKSSLLGALARAAEVQERILGARIEESAGGLRDLRDVVYSGRSPDVNGAVASYVVQVRPFLSAQADGAQPFDVVLLECDGQASAAMLAGTPRIRRGPTNSVLGADAVLLLLDAAAPADHVDRDLTEFVRFLKQFRGERGERSDVAALPVCLVMTKCDLLARPGDTLAVWTERLEARKEEAAARFEEVSREAHRASFGTLAFHTAAVAVRRPGLANAEPRPDEPCGVADLFARTLTEARSFHERRQRSDVRVNRTMTGAFALGALLLMFAAALVGGRTLWRPSPLSASVQLLRDREGPPPAGHLDEPLAGRIDALVEVARDPEFGRLPARDRAFVTDRLEELRQYNDYATRLRQVRPPSDARDLGELKRLEEQLQTEFAPPADHREAWAASAAGQLRDRRLRSAESLAAAVQKVVVAYDDQRQAFDRLFVLAGFGGGRSAVEWPAWSEAVQKTVAASDEFPIRAGDKIPDSPAITYSVPLAFSEADLARSRWTAARARVETLREIARAVALIPSPGPTLRPADGMRPEQTPAWLAELRARFPRLDRWGRNDVSDAAAPAVRDAAMSHYQALLPMGRAEIAGALRRTDDPESADRWRAAVAEAASRAALQAWNEIAAANLRLSGEPSADPLAELSNFLKASSFPIDLSVIRVTIPDSLGGARLAPQDSWRLLVQSSGGGKPYHSFAARGGPARDEGKRTTTFTFAAAVPVSLTYRPGDTLWAELALRDAAGADWQLTWWGAGGRSRLFQFDRLHMSPRLHRPDERPDAGAVADGVRLEFVPPTGVPRLPDLFPTVP